MARRKRIAVVIGTRPEAIKLCPLVLELNKNKDLVIDVVYTGQHVDMVLPVLETFGVQPIINLDFKSKNPSLTTTFALITERIGHYLGSSTPDLVVVQGDTASTLAGAMGAFLNKIPVAHVEAGLRTGNLESPFPEEANRVLVSRITKLHYSPTPRARQNLLDEGVRSSRIMVTGNTGIDALRIAQEKIKPQSERLSRSRVLITVHRRENHGSNLNEILSAIETLAEAFPTVEFVMPVHPNPNVAIPVVSRFKGADNVELREPLGYLEMVKELMSSTLVITDSGGLQEEAPYFQKPVVVLRDTTERPEAVEAGCAILAGTSERVIVDTVTRLLTDEHLYKRMAVDSGSPFGDGFASKKIAESLRQYFVEPGD